MGNLWRDLRLALRRLARERGFAAVAILTLAVGIGANTAVFSIVDGVLLRPLSYPHPEQLISLHEFIPQFAQQYPILPVNAASFAAWRQRSQSLSSLALLEPYYWDLTGAGDPQEVVGAAVSASMFRVLGVSPRLGRAFLPQEDEPGRNHVVILSDAFWRGQFHADPNILGRTIDLNGTPNQIVGVMPANFHFPYGEELGQLFANPNARPTQLFQPLGLDFAKALSVTNFNFAAFARMQPGASAPRVRTELNAITAGMLEATHAPADVRVTTVVTPLRDQIVGSHRLGLWLLLAAVGAILLIVCLNLANLLLVRVHGRGHETAIRVALGASRGRLLQETMSEGVVLALLGGALGVVGACAAVRWLVHAAPAGIPRLDEVGVNGTVLGFSLLVAVASGVLFSLWPALRAVRADPQAALRSDDRGASEAGGRARVREWLVGGQSALAALLLIVAGLLTASYTRLMGVDKGFQTSHTLEAGIQWSAQPAQRAAFYRSVLEKLQTLPGVSAAGLIDTIPTQGTGDGDLLSMPNDPRPSVERPLSTYNAVSSGYFAAMDIPLLRGRTFSAIELAAPLTPAPKGGPRPPMAAVISATTAAKIWPDRDPLGQQFRRGDNDGPLFSVVGVVGDVRSESLQEAPGLAVYLPYTFNVPNGAAVALRTSGGLTELAPAIRRAIWSVQPAAAIPEIATMDEVVASSAAPRRFQMSLVLLFALCALFLAALGIYGVVAYSVARRSAEIGIRITLGARASHLFGMVLRQGLTPVLAGLVVGVAGALASGRMLASLLFGVRASDPAVIAVVSLVLLAVAALACALPARRASRLNPLAALRRG